VLYSEPNHLGDSSTGRDPLTHECGTLGAVRESPTEEA